MSKEQQELAAERLRKIKEEREAKERAEEEERLAEEQKEKKWVIGQRLKYEAGSNSGGPTDEELDLIVPEDDGNGPYYSVDQLRNMSVPGLDYQNREKYMSPADCERLFGAVSLVVARV